MDHVSYITSQSNAKKNSKTIEINNKKIYLKKKSFGSSLTCMHPAYSFSIITIFPGFFYAFKQLKVRDFLKRTRMIIVHRSSDSYNMCKNGIIKH